MNRPVVLDSSALLAWLRDEPGAEIVEPLLDDARMSSVNWCETAQKLIRDGAGAEAPLRRVAVLGVQVQTFTSNHALAAAQLWPVTHAAGLSLGDRACLALARAHDLPVVTADTAWSAVEVDLDVRLIR